ncbi:lipopolysaccharide biosynthesis protein [Geoalkalibacter halelectricus]|uniref:lipopolysaccharide biosynthesis protein n=1 Tax=Geoalkalibacter halelectricus TaxID=2847045 RepID=UPI003D23C48C
MIDKSDLDKKYEKLLNTDHLQKDLGKRSVRSSFVTLASSGSNFFLTMLSTMVLARLITPADFGLFAMVSMFTSFLSIFKNLGLGMATIRKPVLTHGEVTNVFWVNNFVSAALALIIIVMAPGVAWFYDDARLTLITVAVAAGFIVSGLGIQHNSLLRRQMRFTELAGVNISSLMVGIFSGISAAYLGATYWSLVILQFVTVFTNTSLCWFLCKWRPGLPRRDVNVREMVFFGGNLTGSRIIGYFNLNLGNILIGRYVGAASLGFFDKANQLLHMPVHQFSFPVGSVAIPALSSLQSTPDRFRSYYRYAVFFIGLIAFPLVFVLVIFAEEVVLIVLGSQWNEVTPIFRLLAPASVIGILSVALRWTYISLGRANKQLRWGIVDCFFNFLFLGIGIQFGVLGVAVAFSAKALLLILPETLYCFKGTFITVSDLLKPLIYSITYAAMACGAVWYLKIDLDLQWNPLVLCIVGGIVYLFLYLLLYTALPPSRKILIENLKKLKANL